MVTEDLEESQGFVPFHAPDLGFATLFQDRALVFAEGTGAAEGTAPPDPTGANTGDALILHKQEHQAHVAPTLTCQCSFAHVSVRHSSHCSFVMALINRFGNALPWCSTSDFICLLDNGLSALAFLRAFDRRRRKFLCHAGDGGE